MTIFLMFFNIWQGGDGNVVVAADQDHWLAPTNIVVEQYLKAMNTGLPQTCSRNPDTTVLWLLDSPFLDSSAFEDGTFNCGFINTP